MKRKSALDVNLYQRACQAIAHGALTNSKRPESFVKGVYPTHLVRGHGCYVWDTFGNRYTDFICGLGSNLLGYANEEVTGAITRQAMNGGVLSLGTQLEVECAEKVKEMFPFIERLRFLKSGSEACTAAIRIARAYTGKSIILSEGYHGWHDEFVSLTPPGSGVNYFPNIFPLSMIDALFVDHTLIAAIILEPIMTDARPERIEYLRALRQKCTDHKILLIFDEVITGLRFPNYSVSSETGVTPDLICLGKALAGGLPLSVVAGKAEIMESDYFVSSTFGGDTVSLAAGLKTMQLMQTKYKIDYLWEKGAQFLFKFNDIWRDGIRLEGYPTRSVFKGDPMHLALFMQECCKAGILVGPSFFFIFPHIPIMDEILSTFSDILRRIQSGSVSLEGEMPLTPFAQKMRQ